MSFTSAAGIWATTMVREPILSCDAPWFNPHEARNFSVAGCLVGNGMLPKPLLFDHILSFE